MIEQILSTGGDISSIAVLGLLLKNYIELKTLSNKVNTLWGHIFNNKNEEKKHV